MKFNKMPIEGVYEVVFDVFQDERGSFIKTFHSEIFKEIGFVGNFKESFYSISKKDVIRGMYFQLPPFDHDKFVYVIQGAINDVILDLRKGSPTYGQSITLELSADRHNGVFIPQGLAHGFSVSSDIAISLYMNTTIYNKDHDTGIRRDSFGHNRGISEPIMSERDKNLIKLEDFSSPF